MQDDGFFDNKCDQNDAQILDLIEKAVSEVFSQAEITVDDIQVILTLLQL